MPRYEYRHLEPHHEAADAYDRWIAELDREFENKDIDHRSEVVRDALHQIPSPFTTCCSVIEPSIPLVIMSAASGLIPEPGQSHFFPRSATSKRGHSQFFPLLGLSVSVPLPGHHTDVLGTRANELVGGVLLDRVANPADGPPDGKDDERR